MPTAAPKPCTVCRKLVHDGTARCDAHKVRPGSFADARRGSRGKRGYGHAWDKLRETIKQRANGLCEPCLAEGLVHEGHHCDHVVSKAEWMRVHGSLAGVDDPSNLRWMHRDCHAAKTVIDRMRAAGSDVPPWRPAAHPTPAAATVSKSSGLGAAPCGSPSTGGPGGGEKSGAPEIRTDRFPNFLRAQVSRVGGVAEAETHPADDGVGGQL